VTFFFAPHYHPAFKSIAPVRRKLANVDSEAFQYSRSAGQSAHPTHNSLAYSSARWSVICEVLRLLK